MPLAYNPTTSDGRRVAENNELEVLKAIRFFGHLRRTEVARAVWPHSSDRSAYIMAQRTVKRMIEKNYLLDRANILGSSSLILASKGVARLLDASLTSVEGYDMSSISGPQFYHRTMGTCFLIDRARNEEVVFGEYAVSRGWAPIKPDFLKAHYRKVPDGITVTAGSSRGYAEGFRALDWVEVESAYKPDAVLLKLIQFALRFPEIVPEHKDLVLDQVVFVYDTRQGHEPRLLRVLRAFLKTHPELNDPERLSHLVFARAHIEYPMQWLGVTEHSAWELLNGATDTLEDADDSPAPVADALDAAADFEPDEVVDGSTVPPAAKETPSSWGVLRSPAKPSAAKPK